MNSDLTTCTLHPLSVLLVLYLNWYFCSALNKSRIKWTVLLHWLLFALMAARLAGDILKVAQVDVPLMIEQLNLPAAKLWELGWQPSIMASMFAQLSLRRNNVSLLWQAMLGKVSNGLEKHGSCNK